VLEDAGSNIINLQYILIALLECSGNCCNQASRQTVKLWL